MTTPSARSASALLPSSSRALSLYRSLLRAARSLPSRQDRESLEEETKRRFRAEREKEKKKRAEGGGSGEGGGDTTLSALLDEGEARLHDARHHGIPHARLEHAAQIPRAVLESARKLFSGSDDGGGGGGAGLTRNKGARAKLEAAVERRRVKRRQQLEEEEN